MPLKALLAAAAALAMAVGFAVPAPATDAPQARSLPMLEPGRG